MKRLIQILFILFIMGLSFGFYYKNTGFDNLGDKIVGISIIFVVLVLMPVFIYHQSKGKKLKDYMLTQENLKKMREKREEKGKNPKNQ